MSHGIRLFAQIQQCSGNPASDIKERQVPYLTGSLAQARGHLFTNKVQHPRILLSDFPELGVADFCHFALSLGLDPGTPGIHVVEQPHLAEEITGIKVRHDHFTTIVVFNNDSDRALDDVEQGIAFITRIDDGAFGWVTPAMALGKEVIQVFGLLLNRLDNGSHNARHASSESGDS